MLYIHFLISSMEGLLRLRWHLHGRPLTTLLARYFIRSGEILGNASFIFSSFEKSSNDHVYFYLNIKVASVSFDKDVQEKVSNLQIRQL